MFCANEVGDNLCLTLTSTPELISEELASQFLERVASHLSTMLEINSDPDLCDHPIGSVPD